MFLMEMLIAIPLIVGTILFMGEVGTAAFRWHETAVASMAITTSSERLRTLLDEALRTARPIETLSLGEKGELVEEPLPGALRSWRSDEALVLRGSDAYWIFERDGTRLVRRRIGFDGRAEVLTVVPAITAATWRVTLAGNRPVGLAYSVVFAARPKAVEGFVALRVTEVPSAPPASPRPTPRYTSTREPGGGK
jgi:hypothetical protein